MLPFRPVTVAGRIADTVRKRIPYRIGTMDRIDTMDSVLAMFQKVL